VSRAKVSIEGADTLQRTLAAAARELQDFAEVHAAAAARIAKDAAARAPHRTGRLAASIRATSDRTGGLVAAGGGSVGYAKFQEYGWAHGRAQPYLRPALQDNRDAVLGLYRDRVHSIVGNVKGK
jgi:HK97 gp10 family phage protein